ncbi:pyrroline-5-carboxylate reductase [Vibrio gazogenes]|uniref:Pyrroline-5-carboxylate reductase n=1 Tax=Vibrio gazogenes DSM 21264 = NBRC 103151 TaxID=1123492 RepID=A0A1M4YTS3_VIBGA|nr:pyrroline-5-carboxylate reductase [Vibrio gazogenes]USP15090.1 pyrroline-5-carboxylate reductase [Vibrio gazogenes]SHF08957.1 pyrroline-5-carboxylate reductase [Vibrio gazogenes DSM 21264] [Vibrio gazogenes DSM 21264 = NBRC 103151]
MTQPQKMTMLVIGGGKMGGAIIQGWLKTGLDASHIYLVDMNESVLSQFKQLGINTYKPDEIEQLRSVNFSDVLLALKPQMIGAFAPDYRQLVGSDTCLMSIAAGVSIEQLRSIFTSAASIVRIMPNTPVLVGKGVVVAYTDAGPEIRDKTAALFEPLGNFYWLDHEDQMHAATAVSGSGPAYIFYFCECFMDTATKMGLPEDLAQKIAKDTFIGAAKMIEQQESSVAELRQNVTSPNGTTQAGLERLAHGGLITEQIKACCEAACQRSIEISMELSSQ